MSVMSNSWLGVVETCRKEAGWPGQKNRVLQNFCHDLSLLPVHSEAIWRAPDVHRQPYGEAARDFQIPIKVEITEMSRKTSVYLLYSLQLHKASRNFA